jgi:hypothetical protein
MSRTRRPPAGVALVAAAVLINGCGSSASSGAGAADGTLARARQGVKFADCMRGHGVSNFRDPDASGRLTIDAVANGRSINTQAPAFTQAISACRALEPAGFTGGRRSSAQQSAALKFARCIRSSGVPDFPDPVNGQPLIDTDRIPSFDSPGGKSRLHAAMQNCRSAAAATGVTR